jgi:hypothetical protein
LYVPIPENASAFQPGCERRYAELIDPLAQFIDSCGVADAALQSRIHELRDTPMHLDPDFEHLTYGDNGNRRGSKIRALNSGDLVVFYAGLQPMRPYDHKLIYAIIGLFAVDKVVAVQEVEQANWHKNAHTRKRKWGPHDIVVQAKHGSSGRCVHCIPIGEFRDRAYRVRNNLLKEWGGLSVNDGYIQRSATPPEFTDANQFYRWWLHQDVELVQNNF